MALTAPAALSLFSNAVRPRGVYLSGPAKVFAIWTVREWGGTYFAAKRHDGATGTEFLIPVAPDHVLDFDVAVLTSSRAAVVYTDGESIKYFVYDFVADSLITNVTILTVGIDPSVANDGELRTTYLKDNIVKMITELSGDPVDLVDSPAYVLREHNIGRKQPYIINYLAAHSQSVDIALPIRADVNSEVVNDCRDTIHSGSPSYYDDKSGNGNTLDVYSGALDSSNGLFFLASPDVRITNWDVPAFFVTLESLFIPSGMEHRGRMLDGDLFMGYDAWDRAYWGYIDGTTVHKYQQTRLTGFSTKRLNYLAVTHQWGVAASTKLYVNGLLVPGEWVRGTGAPDPALGTITSTVVMGHDDYLVQLAVNNTAKTQADIEDYAKGRL